MKVAIITDTHHGVKNNSNIIHDLYRRYYSEVFFPYLVDNNIKILFHLGDLVDVRHHITGLTLNRLRADFLDPLNDIVDEAHFLIGNHDCVYKNTLTPNYVSELLSKYNNNKKFIVHDKPSTRVFNKKKIDFVPWICSSNKEEIDDFIKKSKSSVLLGHFEFSGFLMYKNQMARSGISTKGLQKYHTVLSGHYHTRSTQDNISYLGCPLDITWADYDDPKGFHVMDLNTLELEFIRNPIELHREIIYNDLINIEETLESCKDKIVRVICKEDYKPYEFQLFLDKLSKISLDYKISDYTKVVSLDESIDIHDPKVIDLLDIFKKSIGINDEDELLNIRINEILTDIYNEAIRLK